MGMFDTFYGDIKCPHCNKNYKFEEQTKNYECLLQEFEVGDYIDKGNQNYLYNFESYCPHCKNKNKISLAIRRGQFIGIFIEDEINITQLLQMDNIEDGLTKNNRHKKRCEDMLGPDKNIIDLNTLSIEPGNTITVLEKDWIIDEVFKEKSNKENPSRIFFKDNFIVRVHNNNTQRILVLRDNQPARLTLPTFEQKEKWTEDDYETRYITQYNCTISPV